MKYSTNPYLFFITLTIFSVIYFQTSFAQDCEPCGRRKLVVYDFNIPYGPFDPNDTLAIDKFYTALKLAPYFGEYLKTKDPSHDCLKVWIPERTPYLTKDMLKVDPQIFYNLANNEPHDMVEGNKFRHQYVLVGTVMDHYPDLVSVAFLFKAKNGEYVYTNAIKASPENYSPDDVGLFLMQYMGPLYTKIREFEVKQINSGPPWAVFPKIHLEPESTTLDFKESTNIKIKLADCDDVNLGNRDIKIEVIKGSGTLDKSLITTEDNGESGVVFTAGTDTGIAEIRFTHTFIEPWNKNLDEERVDCVDETFINIRTTKPLWVFEATIKNSYTSRNDTTINYDLGGHPLVDVYSFTVEEETSGRVKALIENLAEDPVNNFSYDSDALEPLALFVSGNGSMDQFARYEESIDGKLSYADIRKDYASGSARPGASIQFDYSDEYKYFGSGIGIKGIGGYDGRQYFYEWSDYGGQYDDYGLSATCGCNSEDVNCSIVKSDSGFKASYTFTESLQKSSLEGTQFITTHQSIEASIVPFNSITGIDDEDYNKLFPKEFSLSQNYPNPFNPLTNITFQMKNRDWAKLKVYDLLGVEVATLFNGITPQGTYTISWDASNVPSGVYIYQLQAGSFVETKKMMLLK